MLEKLPLELIDKCFKNKIVLLRMTSKKIRHFLNIIQQPIALTINSKWLRDTNNGSIPIKHDIIIKSITTFNNISKLVLNNCRIDPNTAHKLEQALKNNTHLIFLRASTEKNRQLNMKRKRDIDNCCLHSSHSIETSGSSEFTQLS
jgi:hypothetical protein